MLPALAELPLDRESIAQSKLDIEDRTRRNLLQWNGQFSPQLVHALLECHTRKNDIVLDPFAGSGTTLVESARLGLQSIGTEINPAACHMAKVYTLCNQPPEERLTTIASASRCLEDSLPEPFLNKNRLSPEAIQKGLIDCCIEQRGHIKTLLAALIVQLDFFKPGLDSERVFSAWQKLAAVVRELPYSEAAVELINRDARQVALESDSVDLVLTSPPYINVFNYHQQFRRSVEALGWNLLNVAKSEIGSNRKHRGNRFLTVIQFCLDMSDVLLEMKRVLKRTGKMLFVVGRESNVRKTRFLNGDIVAKLAVGCCGLSLSGRQERVYRNKFGIRIYEDILTFKKPKSKAKTVPPDDVAKIVLEDAIPHAPHESRIDLNDAISAIGTITRSPLYSGLQLHDI